MKGFLKYKVYVCHVYIYNQAICCFSCRDFLRESVICFMSSPVYSLRKLSAQAYVALSALDMADETLAGVLQKMGQRTMKMNELHGWLLCVHCLMASGTIRSVCWIQICTHIFTSLRCSQASICLFTSLYLFVHKSLFVCSQASICFFTSLICLFTNLRSLFQSIGCLFT